MGHWERLLGKGPRDKERNGQRCNAGNHSSAQRANFQMGRRAHSGRPRVQSVGMPQFMGAFSPAQLARTSAWDDLCKSFTLPGPTEALPTPSAFFVSVANI